jgi:drug/metabolite transporter (DMT)-like permease
MAPSILLLAGDWETDANAWQWGLALLSGMPFAGLGHLLLLHAHRFSSAPELAPWFYTQIIWITIGGYVIFGDLPDAFTILGCALIITACFLVLRLELRSARRLASAQVAHPNN